MRIPATQTDPGVRRLLRDEKRVFQASIVWVQRSAWARPAEVEQVRFRIHCFGTAVIGAGLWEYGRNMLVVVRRLGWGWFGVLCARCEGGSWALGSRTAEN